MLSPSVWEKYSNVIAIFLIATSFLFYFCLHIVEYILFIKLLILHYNKSVVMFWASSSLSNNREKVSVCWALTKVSYFLAEIYLVLSFYDFVEQEGNRIQVFVCI